MISTFWDIAFRVSRLWPTPSKECEPRTEHGAGAIPRDTRRNRRRASVIGVIPAGARHEESERRCPRKGRASAALETYRASSSGSELSELG
jgi:hypothetical protein